MKSKKRFGVSSKSKPHEPVVFFLDRSLGKRIIASALRGAGVEVRVHDDHFTPDAQDKDWLPAVGERGWIVLTKDRRIRYRAAELTALQKAHVRLFTLIARDLQGPEMADIFIKALPAIEKFAARNSPPFIAKIARNARVSMWVRAPRRRSRDR